MRRALAFAAFALILVLAPKTARSDDWNRSFTVHDHPDIVIRTNDGHVHVTEGPVGTVTVRVHTNRWRIGRHVLVSSRQSGDRVEIEARAPKWNFGLSFSFHESRELEIDVQVPRKSDLEVRTGDGGVEVERVAGRIELNTGDGHIKTESLQGDIRMHTGDGGVEAYDVDGRLFASSGDGSVRVSGRFDGLELETGDGRVIAEALKGSKVNDGWSIESGDGPVTLRLASAIAAEVDAQTNDGSINVDFPIEVSGGWGSHKHLHGALNGGGAPIRLRTGDGSIHLEKI